MDTVQLINLIASVITIAQAVSIAPAGIRSLLAGINKKRQLEDEMEKQDSFMDALKDSIEHDRYRYISFLSDTVYPVCLDALQNGNPSAGIIEISYLLTDIFDYQSDGEKSVTLAKGILAEIERSGCPKTERAIRYMIGCASSLIIAKNLPEEEKENCLYNGERWLVKAKTMLESADTELYLNALQKQWLLGLYYSNHAALYLNKTDENDPTVYFKACNSAMVEYKESLRHKQEAYKYLLSLGTERVDNVWEDTPYSISRVWSMITQGRSNIASTYYRLGQYRDAIKLHSEVLHELMNENDSTNIHLTKEYIVGCYVQLAQHGETITSTEQTNVFKYISDCEKYYRECDKGRLSGIQEKKEMWDTLTAQ